MASGWGIAENKTHLFRLSERARTVPIVSDRGLFWIDVEFDSLDVNTVDIVDVVGLERISTVLISLEDRRSQGHLPLFPPGECEACDMTKRQRAPLKHKTKDENYIQERKSVTV
jgi:hypothetical protein